MEIKTIMSSSAGCCYLMEHEDEQLLIECGAPMKTVRKALDFDLSKITGCLVSHIHRDHCKYLNKLSFAGITDIFGPPSLQEDFPNDNIFVMQPGVYYQHGNFLIRAFLVDHDVECYAFEVDAGDEKLFYLTDSGTLPLVTQDTTHLMIEANHSFELLLDSPRDKTVIQRSHDYHLSIASAVRFAKRRKKTLQEVHLLHLSDEHSNEDQFLKMMQEATGVPVYVAAKS